MEEYETMHEMRSACLGRELITVCHCFCYMITQKGKDLAKSLDEERGLKKDIEHVLDTQLGYNIFREPDWQIDQENFISFFSEALKEKSEDDVRERIYDAISAISERELMTKGASAFFIFTYALDMARNLGYIRHRGENKLELRGPERFFKEEKTLAEVVK